MKLQVKKDVVYVYHEEDEILAILGADENSTMYRISGWFGETFYEVLEGKKILLQVLDQASSEQKEVFLKLIAILVQEEVIISPEGNELNYLMPLVQEERQLFGEQYITKSPTIVKLLAQAHTVCARSGSVSSSYTTITGSSGPGQIWQDGAGGWGSPCVGVWNGHNHCQVPTSVATCS